MDEIICVVWPTPPRNSAFSESQLPPGTFPWSSQFKSPSSFHFKFPSLNQVPQAPHMSSHFALDGSGPGHSGDPRNRTPPHDPNRAHRHGGFENLSPANPEVFSANQSSEIAILAPSGVESIFYLQLSPTGARISRLGSHVQRAPRSSEFI